MVADGQCSRQQVQRHRQAVKKDDDIFPGKAVGKLAAQKRRRQRDGTSRSNEHRGDAVGKAQLGGQKERHHGPDKGAHGCYQLSHKQDIYFLF